VGADRHLPRVASREKGRALASGLAAAVVSVCLTLLVIEAALRVAYPFTQPSWPGIHRPFGFSFRPGATVRWTNVRDFCVEQKANSLGFLDREPPVLSDPEEFRILVLGDSFVEAAQVQPAEKTHLLLEAGLRTRYPDRQIRVSALGFSGSGTGDQLAFYDRFRDRFQPHLVIILFVKNDFANNSLLLESVRNGWDPAHVPRPFFTRVDGVLRRGEVDIAWGEHLLVTPPARSPAGEPGVLSRLSAYSTTAAWIGARLSAPAQVQEQLYAERLSELRGNPAYRLALADWEYPRDEDMDAMFFAEAMPPLFEEAVAITGHILDEFRARAARDHFRLLLVAADNFSQPPQPKKRKLLADGQLRRLRQLAHQRGLAVLDLGEYFTTHGDQGATTFSRDGHWNRTGHRLASTAIEEYLAAHAEEFLERIPL